jgi:hypothetical protein
MKYITIILATIYNIGYSQEKESLRRDRIGDWIEYSFPSALLNEMEACPFGFYEARFCSGDTNNLGQKIGTWCYISDIFTNHIIYSIGEYQNDTLIGEWHSYSSKVKFKDTLDVNFYKYPHKIKKIIFDYGITRYVDGTIMSHLSRIPTKNNSFTEEYSAKKNDKDTLLTIYRRDVVKRRTKSILISDGEKANTLILIETEKLPPTKPKKSIETLFSLKPL